MNGTNAMILAGIVVAFVLVVFVTEYRRRQKKPAGRWAGWKDEPRSLSDYVGKPDGVDSGSWNND